VAGASQIANQDTVWHSEIKKRLGFTNKNYRELKWKVQEFVLLKDSEV